MTNTDRSRCESCKSNLDKYETWLRFKCEDDEVEAEHRKFQLVQDLRRNNTCLKKCLHTVVNSNILGVDNEEWLDQRVSNVKAMLKGFQRGSEQVQTENDWPEIDESIFELPCRGTYESCRQNEITSEQLKILKKPPRAAADSNTNTRRNETLGAAGNGNSRNTIDNFLRPVNNNKNNIFKNEAASTLPSTSTSFGNDFRTAREELDIRNMKKYGKKPENAKHVPPSTSSSTNYAIATAAQNNNGAIKKTLGGRRSVRSNFVSPAAETNEEEKINRNAAEAKITDERYANIDPEMIKKIENEIMHKFQPVDWSDIAGLEYAKSIIKESVVYPLLRPDIFTGLRRPPRGILLFGPPGTGKTLIGKCIASQSHSTFFSISASALTSKFVGEGEKMVRTLFAVAAVHQPSVVFIDEIDSLLTQRSESEHESSRRLKTEFLIQLDGAVTSNDDRIVIVGATNRPQELDEAARRRLVRRLYIPLPELEARTQILQNLMQTLRHNLSASDIQEIAQMTTGFSGADIDTLCRDASLEPIRSIPFAEIATIQKDNLRPVNRQDFHTSLRQVRPSVSQNDLQQYTEWNNIYGSGR